MSRTVQINRWMLALLAPAAALLPSASALAVSSIADFENVPGGNIEGEQISDQYKAPLGISFQYEDGSLPILVHEKPAIATTTTPLAFWNHQHQYNDHVLDGQDVGDWFIARGFPDAPPALDVNFSAPVSSAGGEIIDIDRKKAWQIDAFSATDSLLGSITLKSHTQGTGDGVATPWSFSDLGDGIAMIRISYVGGNKKMGFGMDNFYAVPEVTPQSVRPAAVPLPPAALSGLAGLLGLGAMGLMKRRTSWVA